MTDKSSEKMNENKLISYIFVIIITEEYLSDICLKSIVYKGFKK